MTSTLLRVRRSPLRAAEAGVIIVAVDPCRCRDVRGRMLRSSPERSNPRVEEPRVDEDAFNLSVRKFLKQLGVTAQREIELSVREQLEAGELAGDETLEARATVVVSRLPRDVVVTGTIALT
jgi:hypothetical protein